MSGVLAFAAVTAVLKDLINNGLVDHNLGSTLGEVDVTSLAPDRVRPLGKTGTEKSQINLFLYHVTPNAALRNDDLPSRDRNGNRISNPALAVDLHYLLIVHGAGEFHTEILLGYALQLLHDNPVIARDAIRKTLSPVSPVTGAGVLPPGFPLQSASDLADQLELVKIIPENLGVEDLSKLWTSFQANYRPTASFVASVVLLQSQQNARAPLPVRERVSLVLPLRPPRLDSVEDAANPRAAITSTSKVVLRGIQLRAPNTTVRLGDVVWTPDPSQVQDDAIPVDLSLPAFADLRAGIQGAQVAHAVSLGDPSVPHAGFESGTAAFVLHPTITVAKSGVTTSVVNGQTVVAATLTVGFTPPVGKAQRVLLYLNEVVASGSPAFQTFPVPLRLPPDPTLSDTSLGIAISGVTPGIYLVRVQVDGAESPLHTGPDGRYDGPVVVLP